MFGLRLLLMHLRGRARDLVRVDRGQTGMEVVQHVPRSFGHCHMPIREGRRRRISPLLSVSALSLVFLRGRCIKRRTS